MGEEERNKVQVKLALSASEAPTLCVPIFISAMGVMFPYSADSPKT